MIIQIQPWIDDAELVELKRVVDSTFVTEAHLTKEFEELTKELTGAKHAIAMTNGTMALYCCLKSLEVGLGDEVIIPDMTFIATANAVIMAGAKPVFCDINEKTFCIDIMKAKVTSKTKAIMPVHLYGQSADMDEVMKFAKENNLYVIEDAAQGVGVKYNGRHVGTFGNLGVLSYYGNKTITCGEGGIVLTDNDELAKKCYRLKNHGRDTKGTFVHEYIGFNFSFTEMQAAIGISQMKKLGRIIDRKKEIRQKYLDALSHIKNFQPVYIAENCSPVFWFTSYLAESADDISKYLLSKEIQTRRFFYPLHLQPCYKDPKLCINVGDRFQNAEKIFNEGISLPSSFVLTDKEQNYIIKSIIEYYENRN